MFPKDVSKKTFMFLCGFLGFFGAHNFYVGRYIKAIFQVFIGVFSLIATICSGVPFFDFIMTFMFIPVAINAFLWIFDLIDGALNKYRIPVAVDFTEGKSIEEKPKQPKKIKKQPPKTETNSQNEVVADDVKTQEEAKSEEVLENKTE